MADTKDESETGGEKLATILLFVAGAAVLIVLAWGLSSPDFRASIANFEQARGMITFVVAVLAAAIILITMIAIFFVDEKYVDRIDRARDLLTIVVGILGTIIGFYFGAGTQNQTRSETAGAPATLIILPAIGIGGTLIITAKGAAGPYKATVPGEKTTTIALEPDPADPERLLLKRNDALPCPAGLTLTFTTKDGKAAGSDFIKLSRDALKTAGWIKCQ